MMKSKWIRVSMLLASGATMMAWGCGTGAWWWGFWGVAVPAAIGGILGYNEVL